MEREIEKYLGKTIKSFKFSSEVLSFEFTDKTSLNLYANGECCSHSWFESMSGEEALVAGAIVNDIQLVDLDSVWDDDEEQTELTRYYGVKFKTSKGYADADMRNSSNGFYGGFITINDDDQYSDHTLDTYYAD